MGDIYSCALCGMDGVGDTVSVGAMPADSEALSPIESSSSSFALQSFDFVTSMPRSMVQTLNFFNQISRMR